MRNVLRTLRLRRPSVIAALAAAVLVPAVALAGHGDCGQPKSTTPSPTAADALEILKTAVGQSNCGGFDPCVCDVDASGSVVAGDALRTLKKAVGQNVVLGCMCQVTTTSTTTTTIPPASSTELYVMVRTEGSYAIADLAGTWEDAGLATGPAAPWWSRGTLNIQSNGSLTGNTSGSDGSSESISAKLSVAANGIVTCTQNCFPSFRGAFDSGKSVGAVTNTWDDGSSEMLVVTKRAASYAQADLAGTWTVHGMESGPASPHWSRGTLVVESNGHFNADVVASDGHHVFAGTLTLSSTGRITCASAGCSPDFRGALDSGKTVGAITQTVSGGSTELTLLTKRAASYTQAELAGTWYSSSLGAGMIEPFWSRGTLTVVSGGGVTGTLATSSGPSHPVSGKFVVASDGTVTVSGSHLHCSLDAGKTVMACTDSY